jgi:hypothetical protein
MRRAHIALFVLFFLIVAVAAWAAPPPVHRDGPSASGATSSISFNVTFRYSARFRP